MNFHLLIDYINLPKHAAKHIVGSEHNETHHRIAGIFTMIIGVIIAKITMMWHVNFILHILFDVIGYGLHGIGLIPFAYGFEKSTVINNEPIKTEQNEPDNSTNP